MEKKIIYLDHSATTPIDPAVKDAMLPFFSESFGNASSIHSHGQQARNSIDQSRIQIAKFLGCEPKEIIFTGGGTESDNLAVLGVARKLHNYGKHVITSTIEHPAVRNTVRHLKTEGFDVTEIPVDSQGIVKVADIENALRPDTILVSIMFVNNEIGTIQPIQEIAEITSKRNIIFHTDAVQALGKIRIDLQHFKVDLLTATAHKIYGPKGVGLLFMRNGGVHSKYGKYLEPLTYGGSHEFGWRPSTENVAGIVGFSKAIELIESNLEAEMDREQKLRDDFIQWALKNLPDCFLNGHPIQRVANNINLGFRYIEGESLLLFLDEVGIEASTGSACSSHSLEPSHVLLALGMQKQDAHGSLRLTLGRSTTPTDMEYVKDHLKEIVLRLRKYSPLTPNQNNIAKNP